MRSRRGGSGGFLWLAGNTTAAGDLATQSSLALATVSEHLTVLCKAGLVTLEVVVRFWFYRTERARLDEDMVAIAAMQGE